jgi:tRNA1Val (adenine37-N6)-methyltransferase
MSIFKFKEFELIQAENAMKVGTDAMLLGAFANATNRRTGLDVGAGTGVLSLMVAQKNDAISFDAIELDQKSAEECTLNFENSKWSDRLSVLNMNFLDFEAPGCYDLVVSNPPYYQSTRLNRDPRKAMARHESSLPMVEFVKNVSQALTSEGEFWIIIPAEDHKNWTKTCSNFGLHLIERNSIYGKEGGEIKRVILAYSKTKILLEEFSFVIRDIANNYTEAYKELTREYHHNLL